jgi:flagellin
MRINHNIQALNAYRQLSKNQGYLSKHLERLSSGLRINRAADDAAGLAISEKMRSQIRGLAMAERNTMDGISLLQTAEGALGTSHEILQRMRELAVQAANGTLDDQDRNAIQNEIDQLTLELDRIAKATQFNAKTLLRGSAEGRPFASTNSTDITYVSNGTWQGICTAAPTEKAGFNIDLTSALGDAAALEGTTFTINGITYELDGAGDGVANNNVLIDVTSILAPAGTDAAEQSRLDALAAKIKNAIETNDDELEVNLVNSTSTGGDDGIVNPAQLQIRTKQPVAPADAGNFGFVNASGGQSANFVFLKLDNTTTFIPDGTTTGFDTKPDSATPRSISIDFAEVPKIGDSIVIDNVTITFGTPGAAYSGGTATIDPTNKSIYDVLGEIKTILDAASTDGTRIDAVSGYSVVGNSLVLTTNKTKDSGAFGSNNGLEIKFVDNDFEANAGKDLELNMQIGPNSTDYMTFTIGVMDAASLGLARGADHTTIISTPGVDALAGIDVSSSQDAARAAIAAIEQAIKKVSEERAKLGAYQNRMEHTINNLSLTNENLTAAESRIRDADMALEMTNFTKNNIINQSATAMLAQANQLPQGILQLLK